MSEVTKEEFISEMEKAESPKRKRASAPSVDSAQDSPASLKTERTPSEGDAASSAAGLDAIQEKQEAALDVLFPPRKIKISEGLSSALETIQGRIEEHNLTGKSDGLNGSALHGSRVYTRFKCFEMEVKSFIEFCEKEGIE